MLQAIVAMLVITAPPDPAKVLLFNSLVDQQGIPRWRAATRVAIVVALVLGGAALGGAKIAQWMGINLDAFRVVGGVIVAGMGFEMLYGGGVSRAQGADHRNKDQAEEGDGLVMPLAIPLIAGPGAIVTSVSISTRSAGGVVDALVASACVALMAWASFQWLGSLLSRMSASTTALLLRIGGMLLATIVVNAVSSSRSMSAPNRDSFVTNRSSLREGSAGGSSSYRMRRST